MPITAVRVIVTVEGEGRIEDHVVFSRYQKGNEPFDVGLHMSETYAAVFIDETPVDKRVFDPERAKKALEEADRLLKELGAKK